MSDTSVNAAFRAYQEIRDAVLRVKARARAAGAGLPSDYWDEELSNVDYLIEASPYIIRKLRHHAFHITGIRPYDYRVQDDARRDAFEGRLRSLIELGGAELVVPEHEALGGFGYRLPAPVLQDRQASTALDDTALFNIDTIKFLEVLVGMKRGGLLDALRAKAGATVVEIGAGWGGFAYQLATVLPGVRYVVIDFPELFLFSATYLKAVFPDARLAILGQDGALGDPAGADFIFIPNTDAQRLAEFAPDAAINMVSFQEMTSEQVRGYAQLAHEAGCRWLYSLNRERSRYNAQLSSVTEHLAAYYTLRDIPVLDTSYTAAMKKPSKGKAGAPRPEQDEFTYRHVLGERRAQIRGNGPVAGIGATMFNRAGYARTALDSILAQTFRDFRLVLVDDGSSDGTEAICREYAARDPRVTYIRHPTRQGMTATWREAFEVATREPSIEYFAWASDHDLWDPGWLEALVRELDRHPEAVLAYPHARRIDEQGRRLDKPTRLFQTAGMADLETRWRHVCRELVASGDMVYGLARTEAMRAAGVFRDVLCPDRLLMAELSLAGEFRQIPGELWLRRQFAGVSGGAASSVQSQKTSLFAGNAPSGRWLPVWVQHGRTLWRRYVSSESDPLRRRAARRRALRYTGWYALRHHQKSTTHKVLFGIYWTIRCGWKKAKHYALLAVFHMLVYGRRAYHRSVYEIAILTRRLGLR